MLASYHHPVHGEVRGIGLPIAVDGFHPEYRPGPSLGGDRDRILREMGVSEDETRALARGGAFGRTDQN
jgi:crotonobetainyl-CoA:carnitine CoA-transferase CaiB-like acyl-CoA transferase